MSKAAEKRQRAARLDRAIERLAKLVDNRELLAATDPATLLDAVCSRVDEAERARDEATEHARRQDGELAQVRRAYLHEMAEREASAQRVAELEAEAAALRKRNLHLETTVTASLGEQVAKVASMERELALNTYWSAEARAVVERAKRRLKTTDGRALTVAELMENALHDLANAQAAKVDALEAYERIRLRAGSLERELAIAKAAIPEMVTCSGCGCHALVIDLGWNTRQYHFAAGGLCGHWLKDGKSWVLPCEHPADVVEQTTEVGE